MKQTTRDNIIYLAVGLALVGLLAADFFYADSHGRRMWLPSYFAIRTAAYMGVIVYFVVKETRKVKATLAQTIICSLVASILHLGIAFMFRDILNGSFGLILWVLAVLEISLIVWLMVRAVIYLRSRSHEA